MSGSEDASTLAAGETIGGRYRIIDVLGEGAAGVVYCVEHEQLKKQFALKTLRREAKQAPNVEERFRIEAQAIAALDHEHVLRVTDFGQDPRVGDYMVTEMLEGQPLDEVDVSLDRSLELITQLLRGVEHAHGLGIIHRDLKPANVLVIEKDGSQSVKILDFGLAKLLREGSPNLTQAGTIFGTPRYMSPEQSSGDTVDHRSDLYAVGVILYQLVSGRPPFDGDSVAKILMAHVENPIPHLTAGATEVSVLQPVVEKALAKHPIDRFPDASSFRLAVESARDRLATPSSRHAPDNTTTPGLGDTALSNLVVTGAEPSHKRGSLKWGWFAFVILVAALFVIPLWMGSNDAVFRARDALDKGQTGAAQAMLLEAHNADPDDAEIVLWQGHAAVQAEEFDEACDAYDTALSRAGGLARKPRFVSSFVELLDSNSNCAKKTFKIWVDNPQPQHAELMLKVAQSAKSRLNRRDAYETLVALDELDYLEPRVWLEAELDRVAGAGCSTRKWYVLELIKLNDPNNRPILENQLHAKDNLVGLFSRSSCMERDLRDALKAN